MTTIAYSARHRMIAADMQATANGICIGYVHKIWRIGQLLFGGAGTSAFLHGFRDWTYKGMNGNCPKMGDGNPGPEGKGGAGLVFLDDLVVVFDDLGIEKHRAPFSTFGSGSDIARGVLEFGGTPEDAVRAAIRHDIYSGGDIDVIRLP